MSERLSDEEFAELWHRQTQGPPKVGAIDWFVLIGFFGGLVACWAAIVAFIYFVILPALRMVF